MHVARGKNSPFHSHRKVIDHSPTGFEWGYGGSGPSQLALSLLLETVGSEEAALRTYNDFKFEFVAGLPDSCWAIDINEIRFWFEEQEITEAPF